MKNISSSTSNFKTIFELKENTIITNISTKIKYEFAFFKYCDWETLIDRTIEIVILFSKNRSAPRTTVEQAPVVVYKPRQSAAVAAATAKHTQLFNTISAQHSEGLNQENLPKLTAAVEKARQNHQQLFQTTIHDHELISEELKLAQEEAEKLRLLQEEAEEK